MNIKMYECMHTEKYEQANVWAKKYEITKVFKKQIYQNVWTYKMYEYTKCINIQNVWTNKCMKKPNA